MKIITILMTLFISSCGFNMTKPVDINFKITGNNEFKQILIEKLNPLSSQELTLKILKVNKNEHDVTYKNNKVISYSLNLSISFEVYKDAKVILKNTLSLSRYLKNFDNNVNDHQDIEAYENMQNNIANKIIRSIKKL